MSTKRLYGMGCIEVSSGRFMDTQEAAKQGLKAMNPLSPLAVRPTRAVAVHVNKGTRAPAPITRAPAAPAQPTAAQVARITKLARLQLIKEQLARYRSSPNLPYDRVAQILGTE